MARRDQTSKENLANSAVEMRRVIEEEREKMLLERRAAPMNYKNEERLQQENEDLVKRVAEVESQRRIDQARF